MASGSAVLWPRSLQKVSLLVCAALRRWCNLSKVEVRSLGGGHAPEGDVEYPAPSCLSLPVQHEVSSTFQNVFSPL